MALLFANNNSLSAISALPASVSGGALNLIATQTASGSANLSFTSGIDSTYDKYMFVIINWNPNDNNYSVNMNGATDGPSNPTWTVVKTSVAFETGHGENNVTAGPVIYAGPSLANSTGFQQINRYRNA